MFKSLYSRYITAFMLIIAVGYLILAGVLGIMVARYSRVTNENSVVNSAQVISTSVSQKYSSDEFDDFNMFIYYEAEDIISILDAVVQNHMGSHIFITDASGNVLACDENSEQSLTGGTLELGIPEDGDYSFYSAADLGGALREQMMVCITIITDHDGAFCGYAVSTLDKEAAGRFMRSVLRTIGITSLWVLAAALVSVYFISERIVTPIKSISSVAKRFAHGDFKARIPVRGKDEVAELAVAFNNMAESLETMEKSRSAFISNVSHELRTPMTSISGFVDGMLDGAIPPEKYNHYLGIISQEVKRLSRLITSLLRITRIEAGDQKWNKGEFDICETARRIIISFERSLLDRKLDVEFVCDEDNMLAYADPDAIYQILYNLCDNAIKFSREGGKYRVSIARSHEKIYVSVFNEGVGIPEDELPFVFDRFYKADKSRGLDKSGLGLGLYICKAIMNAHGEELWVKSKYGENCEFIFTLQSALRTQ